MSLDVGGIGVSFNLPRPPKDQRFILRHLLTETPSLIVGLDPSALAAARTMAVLLFHNDRATQGWFARRAPKSNLRFDTSAAANVLLAAAISTLELRRARECGVFPFAEVLPNVPACDACAALEGRRFPIAEVPELPIATCTCARGCLCTYVFSDE